MKKRSIAALAVILGTAAFTSQPIEVRADESHWTGEGMPSEQRDRWMSSASTGAAMLESGRYDLAIRYLTAALDSDARGENAAYVHRLRGDAYRGKGDFEKAAAEYSRAVNFVPSNADGYSMRGQAYDRMGNYKAAASDYAKGIALSPDNDTIINSLAWLRATCPDASVRDGREAVRAGTRACELTRWKDSTRIDTLAAAYAEIRDFGQAVKLQQQALQSRSGAPDLRQGMQERLSSYQQRKPYREPVWLRGRR